MSTVNVENLKKIEEKVGLALFNMSLYKVLESGRDSWTNKDFIDNALFTVHDVWKDLDKPLITEEYMRSVIETAAEIAKFPVADLYGYIAKYGIVPVTSNKTDYNSISKDRLYSLVCGLINDDLEDMTITDVYEKLDRVGFTDAEIEYLGYSEILYE